VIESTVTQTSDAAETPLATPHRRRRALLGTATTLVVLAAAGGIGYGVLARPHGNTGTPDTVAYSTATIERGTITERTEVSGTLGYAGSYQVTNQLAAPGVLTWTPQPGATVHRGDTVYRVDGTSVRLLIGSVPDYRAFHEGMSDGLDVKELEQNLVAMGYDPNHTMTADDHFARTTKDAIKRWQAAQDLPSADRTGTLAAGAVVFEPRPIRVDQVSATPGTRLPPNTPVVTGTSTATVVTAQVTTDQLAPIRVRDKVAVTLPDSPAVTGTVTHIGKVATTSSGNGQGDTPQGGGQNADQNGGGQNSPASVTVTIAVTPPKTSANLEQAPAQVAITTAEHKNALTVPVAALLARPGGGYQVRMVSGQGGSVGASSGGAANPAIHTIEVTPGLFDDVTGRVEISGTGLTAGQQVEVPRS
jgi:Putative peptidoglycan binding domain